MKHLLLTASLVLSTVSLSCFAQNRGNESVKPSYGKFSYENFLKDNVVSSQETSLNGWNQNKMVQEQSEIQKAILFDSEENEVKFRAFSLYDQRIRSVSALVKFSSLKPNDYKLVFDYAAQGDGYKYVGAATYVNDKVYAYTMSSYPGMPSMIMPPFELAQIDVETGAITKLADMNRNVITDLAYDPTTKYLYGSAYDVMQNPVLSELYRINPETPGEVEKMASLYGELIYSISVDNGYIYAIACSDDKTDTKLMRVKISDIKCDGDPVNNVDFEVIKTHVGIKAMPAYQDMEIDKTTHRLFWWAQVDNGDGKTGHSEMLELNPKTGEIISQVKISADAQLTGLCAPYQVAADKAPNKVKDLKVSTDANGASQAVIEWTNPTTDYQNNALGSISGVEIFRNGVSVAKVTDSMTPGKKCSYTDKNVETANYVYRIQPYNNDGVGIYREKSIFVGRDVPAAPANVVLTGEGTKGTLTWKAPTAGLHDGWMDASSIKYDIVRFPGEVKVATDVTATTYEDEVTELGGYYYEVIAKNNDGVGGKAKSNTVSFGGVAEIPFINSLRTQAEFDLCTVLDANNDGTTWQYSLSGYALYSYSLNEADDYLFTPELKFEAGKQYQVRYSFDDAHWVEEGTRVPVNERLAVYYAPKAENDNMVRVASHDAIHNLKANPVSEKAVFTAKENGGCVAFKCWSEPDRGLLKLMDISVREYSDKDISALGINGSATANVNAEQIYNVIVGNEGKSPVSDFKVVLFNAETKEVLGEAKGMEIAVDTTASIAVSWVPKQEGKVMLSARVELEGDTYMPDNEKLNAIEVVVAEEGGNQFFTVNKINQSGWAYPFYLNYLYNQNQCIYLDTEMSMKDIVLTGVQFVYNNLETQVSLATKVRISIMSTEQAYFPYDEAWNVYLIKDGDWQVVYEGEISVDELDDNVKLYIPFDKEYKYVSGNIVVKYERLYDADNVCVEGPQWQFCDNGEADECNRSAGYRTNKATEVDNIVDAKTVCSSFTPYTAFSYHKNGSGIEGTLNMGTDGFSIVQTETTIRFNNECELVEIFDIAGAKVATAQNVQEMNIEGFASGVYVVRVVIDGVNATNKFIVG